MSIFRAIRLATRPLRTALGLRRARPVRSPDWRSTPWLTDGAVDFIEALPPGRVLEFGAGSSTLYFARRGFELVSFEHDEAWHAGVAGFLADMPNAQVHLRPRPYWEAVTDMPDAGFDLVLVDGRDRVDCVREARRLVRPGGVMVVDNTERIAGRYAAIPALLEGWPRRDFEQRGPDRAGWKFHHPEGRHITTVWTRPDGA